MLSKSKKCIIMGISISVRFDASPRQRVFGGRDSNAIEENPETLTNPPNAKGIE